MESICPHVQWFHIVRTTFEMLIFSCLLHVSPFATQASWHSQQGTVVCTPIPILLKILQWRGFLLLELSNNDYDLGSWQKCFFGCESLTTQYYLSNYKACWNTVTTKPITCNYFIAAYSIDRLINRINVLPSKHNYFTGSQLWLGPLGLFNRLSQLA